MDDVTRAWIRNEGDERAVHNGCRFDLLRGAWTVFWIERYCRLYEGEGYAGQPVILHGCHECDHSHLWAVNDFDDDQDLIVERAMLYAECVAAGHQCDWQYEAFMQTFGWVRPSEKWKRDVRRFRQMSIWIPKKSKKSPSLSALGMYLLAGDGEPGQKVFLAAKDGEQARTNTAKHAFEMLLQSEELQAECTPNKTIMQITHEPSRSIMRPLSSSNSRTQESKEGLNGSILIDETHVVDRAFVDRISRAGISRSEPLFAEFSTAGNNPDGYGKERFDYASDVLAGKAKDEELYAAIYAAPQDVTDDQLESDFDRYARMANPALGHTIDPAEIRADYERSKVTLEKLATFKMYRLNVWQHSSNPWLRQSDWAKCAAKYTEEDLLGKTCVGGMDLALKWDLSAIVLLFDDGEREGQQCFKLWPYFFLPEETARQAKDSRWATWKASKHVTLTSGNTTDFPLIRRTIGEIRKKFDLVELGYDPRFAESFAGDLQDEDRVPIIEVKQSPAEFSEPLGLFESDVVGGRIQHPDNPCFNWQAGNATLGRNGMLLKPDGKNGAKKIDGIVAAVMARAIAGSLNLQTGSYYDSNPVEFI